MGNGKKMLYWQQLCNYLKIIYRSFQISHALSRGFIQCRVKRYQILMGGHRQCLNTFILKVKDNGIKRTTNHYAS